ncbi:MAG: ribosome recycling factor [Thermodesulfobacteriota bacterium]|nr:ribosome recycling factor [Thermodesulfobacteriota bacterium]
MINELLKDMRKDMDKAVFALKHAFQKIRTGRASIGIMDGIMVDYFGTPTPINQLASLSVPDPRMITVQPWDKGALGPIEKAIFKSELGLTPSNDGKLIRIPIPPLNEERRMELVKKVRKVSEDFKVEIRNNRRDTNAMIKDLEKEKEVSQDEMKKAQDKVQEATDSYTREIDELLKTKEQEIMEI